MHGRGESCENPPPAEHEDVELRKACFAVRSAARRVRLGFWLIDQEPRLCRSEPFPGSGRAQQSPTTVGGGQHRPDASNQHLLLGLANRADGLLSNSRLLPVASAAISKDLGVQAHRLSAVAARHPSADHFAILPDRNVTTTPKPGRSPGFSKQYTPAPGPLGLRCFVWAPSV